MYQYASQYYKDGSKPYSKKKKNDFGYEQVAKQSKPKVMFVPVTPKKNVIFVWESRTICFNMSYLIIRKIMLKEMGVLVRK